MQIQAVRFQNCFSFGNEMTEVRLDSSRLTLVVGKNGGGKSSAILDTMVYGLYGKPYRKIKLGQMINSITGRDLLVEVEFEARGRSYMVRRGQKPAVFEVYRDGILVDQAANAREQQDWLEKSVLRMDHRAFVQIVILGSANHVPFMQLSAGQRREVIEDILDIQVFSTMNDVLKERAAEVKAELANLEKDLAVVQRELEVEERHAEENRKRLGTDVAELDARIEGLARDLEEARKESDSWQEKARELTSQIADSERVNTNIRNIQALRTKTETQMERVRTEVNFYREHESCPSCLQTITPAFRETVSAQAVSELERLGEVMAQADAALAKQEGRMREIVDVQRLIGEADKAFMTASAEASRISMSIDLARHEREQAAAAGESSETGIQELRDRVAQQSLARDEVILKARHMGVVSLMLKDGGIKTRIVRQYIPRMNMLVNRYLAALEMFVDFHLDEEFNEEIRSRHRDSFSYESFSEGEKLRIDLAILFAWRDIARERNSSAVGLVVFDEILDGSLDAEGADYFLGLVRGLTEDCRVFIISHREGLEDKFPRVLSFAKRNNFSKMSEIG